MLDDAQRNAALRAAKIRAAKLKYLEPPNICDVPFARRLDRSLQARLALLLWIHGLGGAIQLCVGVGAMTIRLGWTPEFGGALGPPFPLPTLALIKAGTCLVVFGILFRKTRIPPCLAALGCAPVPPKPAGGVAAPAVPGPHVAPPEAVPLPRNCWTPSRAICCSGASSRRSIGGGTRGASSTPSWVCV